jgi:hypothetical protein
MTGPTPRQQAGYLRRLLRRGEILVLDPRSGRPVPVIIELHGEVIHLVPMPESKDGEIPLSEDALRWAGVLARLRRALELDDAEDLIDAVEAEAGRKVLGNAES